MSSNKIGLKKISELKKFHFNVESYQRGYRWDKKQVTDLLEDISQFDSKQNLFYCLQPVVVKPLISDIHKIGETIRYELIDGQQRLTTIYIILSFLNERLYNIEYKTRKESEDFLTNYVNDNLNSYSDWKQFIDANRSTDNIDNFYFFQTYNVVRKWFEETRIDVTIFSKNLHEHTQLIWFEVNDGTDEREIFERINVGKIPLTNAELIKALFLNGKVEVEKREEIAEKWDGMEYALRNERFWYFINPSKNEAPTRIEFVFDLVAGKFDSEENKEQEFHTFLEFQKNVKGEGIDNQWKKVEKTFHVLQEWFETPQTYHYIGFLITTRFESVKELLKKYDKGLKEGEPKSEFTNEVKSLIKLHLKDYKLEDLSYDKTSEKIHKVLLLFNLHTILSTTPENFFPFDRYKAVHWSLEHIHAQHSEDLKKEDAIKKWAEETKPMLEKFRMHPEKGDEAKQLIDYLEKLIQQPKADLVRNITEKVFSFFTDADGEDLHSIQNMALLDKDTNSALNNSVFPLKRKKIFDEERNGAFIPICTKNVFLKYYSEDVSQMYFWSITDKKDYLKQIQNCLDYFNKKPTD